MYLGLKNTSVGQRIVILYIYIFINDHTRDAKDAMRRARDIAKIWQIIVKKLRTSMMEFNRNDDCFWCGNEMNRALGHRCAHIG